jgi:hypothetical protein
VVRHGEDSIDSGYDPVAYLLNNRIITDFPGGICEFIVGVH